MLLGRLFSRDYASCGSSSYPSFRSAVGNIRPLGYEVSLRRMRRGVIYRLLEPKSPCPSSGKRYDVVIVGAGVVGCSLARRISQTGLSVAVVDRASDVGEGGASKSNSAIAHCGFDADPGSLEARLVTSASRRWPSLAQHLKIPFEPIGALMIARSVEDMSALKKYYKRSLENGVDDVQLLNGEETRKLEPLVFEGTALVGGLHIPRESIVDPFATCEAFAETALVQGGCDFFFQADVDLIKQVGPEQVIIHASKQNLQLSARNVINSAGLGAGVLARLYNGEPFTLNPRRGQFLVYDSLSRPLLRKIMLPVPGPLGKGILITPTIFGNLLAGPTAEDLPMDQLSEATQTTLSGLDQVRTSVTTTLPGLKQFKPIAQYAGARSNCQEGSFLFRYADGGNPNIVTLAGIRSTGLTTSFAVADEVFDQMAKRRMIQPKHEFRCDGRQRYPTWYEKKLNTQQPQQMKRTTVCFCEDVDKEDIIQAVRSPMAPKTTDGIKRRTRATTGRCQGFNCLVDICRIVASENKMQVKLVSKRGPGTEWFPGYTDTSSPGYTKTSAIKSSDLFTRMELYNSGVSPIAWNTDERFQVAVVGGGPAGCGVIAGLTKSVKVDKILLLERTDRIGGVPARYPQSDTKKTFVHWTKARMVSGFEFAEDLRQELFSSPFSPKIHIKLNSTVKTVTRDGSMYRISTHDGHSFIADSVVFAMGAREATPVERGCVTGHRSARTVFTNHLLVAGGPSALSQSSPALPPMVSVGAGLVARSILMDSSSSKSPIRFLELAGDESPRIAEHYFGGGRPHKNVNELRVWSPSGAVSGYELNGADREACSSIVLGGNLVPNSEVLVRSALPVETLPERVFTAGNVHFSRFGPWPGVACYLHAKSVVSRQVLKHFY